jgi:hypothetical protein
MRDTAAEYMYGHGADERRAMSATGKAITTASTPRELDGRLRLANQLYREYHTWCFWHCRRDLEITEELLPLVVKGLLTYGGRRGFILASMLPETDSPPREASGCR